MSPERNNFKELFKEEELRFQAKQEEEDHIASNIWRTLDFFKLIGQVIDMFIPKIVELFVAAMGGDNSKINEEDQTHRKIDPARVHGDIDPRKIEPSSPNDDDWSRGPDGAE